MTCQNARNSNKCNFSLHWSIYSELVSQSFSVSQSLLVGHLYCETTGKGSATIMLINRMTGMVQKDGRFIISLGDKFIYIHVIHITN